MMTVTEPHGGGDEVWRAARDAELASLRAKASAVAVAVASAAEASNVAVAGMDAAAEYGRRVAAARRQADELGQRAAGHDAWAQHFAARAEYLRALVLRCDAAKTAMGSGASLDALRAEARRTYAGATAMAGHPGGAFGIDHQAAAGAEAQLAALAALAPRARAELDTAESWLASESQAAAAARAAAAALVAEYADDWRQNAAGR